MSRRHVPVLLFTLVMLLGCRARTEAKPAVQGAADAGPTTTNAIVDAGVANPAAACPPIDRAKVAPFEPDKSLVKTEVPPIVDEKDALAPFYERVAELARGVSKDHLRIAVYGDSNLTEDWLSGHQRRLLQARFGDAGHGFVALARPWAWYNHEDVKHNGTWPLFKKVAVTTDPVFDKHYGLSNFAADSSTAGASAWVGTAPETSTVGKSASRFDLYFLKQKRGGSFDVFLDGKNVRTVTTTADTFEPGYETLEASDGPHEVKCVVKGDGPVRFFGATLERTPVGVVVDSLGCGSLNFQRMVMVDPLTLKSHLERRKYDLVILWLGMNTMWLEPNRQWVKDTIAQIHSALPNVPVLLTTPADSVKEGEKKSDPRIVALAKQLKEVAAEIGTPFWDLRAAMGGDASFLFFMSHTLASPDRHHLLKKGSQVMGERMLSALFTGVGSHLEKHPEAGCPKK